MTRDKHEMFTNIAYFLYGSDTFLSGGNICEIIRFIF